MGYSILSSGQQKKRQALGTFDLLARQERQANVAKDQLEAQEDAQQANAVGTLTAIGAKSALSPRTGDLAPVVDKSTQAPGTISKTAIQDTAVSGAQDAAIDQGIAEVGTQVGSEAVGEAVATEALTTAGTDAAVAAGTEAAAAAGAEVAAAAGAEAAVGGAAAATEGAATASAFGPIGWVIGAGLLAATLFG